ncbi:amino acid ABC transporter permease [Nocardioides sp. LHG3406-4]|uniref:amino acid ABC transporter permease n=1 Tax=Nocardioides sp. LHG3406-4 TaxID=2804575 RepID=UPI003CEF168E
MPRRARDEGGLTAPPAEASTGGSNDVIEAKPLTHWGRWVSAILVLAGVAFLVRAALQAEISYSTTFDFLFSSTVVTGALNTILISVAAQAVGIALGVVAAVMRISDNPVTKYVSMLYVWLFRGTPILVQLLLWYNLALVFPMILGQSTNDLMTPFLAALLGLGINEGAYMAEIIRSGLLSVDEGQNDAAAALGMSRQQALRRVVLPQAMRVIVPPTGNEFINMLKLSSLAYAIQYGELLLSAVKIYTNNLQIVELLLTVSIWYIAITSVFSVLQHFVERRFARSVSGGDVRLGSRIFANLKLGRTAS